LKAVQSYPDARGWIVDLRGNGGGGYGSELIERIKQLPRPVAGLIDAGCMSAGETLARDLRRYAGARLFGSKTAGSSSAKKTWKFPSGIASLTIPTRSRWRADGKPIEYNGIEPDEQIEPVPGDVLKGLNTEILRAEKYILSQPSKRPGPGPSAKELPTGQRAGSNEGIPGRSESGISISGRVVDTEGNPLPRVTLELYPTKGWESGSGRVKRVKTDDQGRFDSPDVAAGRYWMRVYPSVRSAEAPWHQVALNEPLILKAAQRVEDIEVRVLPPDKHVISGMVVDGQGDPRAGVLVDSYIPSDRHWYTHSDERGRFVLKSLNGIGRDPLDVYFNKSGIAAGEWKVVVRDVPIGTDDLKLVVHKPGEIAGVVLEEGGKKPLSGFEITVNRVHLLDCAAIAFQPEVKLIRGDERGAFHITNVPAGKAILEVKVGQRRQWSEVEVRPGQATKDFKVMLRPPCVLQGIVTFADSSKRAEGAELEVVHLETGQAMGSIKSDASGTVHNDTLPAGQYAVRAVCGENYLAKNIRLEHGETAKARFDVGGTGTIRGTVQFPEQDYRGVVFRLRETELDLLPDVWTIRRPAVAEHALSHGFAEKSGDKYLLQNVPEGTWEVVAFAFTGERLIPFKKRPHTSHIVTISPMSWIGQPVKTHAGICSTSSSDRFGRLRSWDFVVWAEL
jgi:hypothetical protein